MHAFGYLTGNTVSNSYMEWSADFLLRKGLSRGEIGKWMKNKSINLEKQVTTRLPAVAR
jgi:hypothetical protein